MNGIFLFDSLVRMEGYGAVCGLDEAGRGPLAGRVYAAACVLPEDFVCEGLNDSKKLSAKKRSMLFEEITHSGADYAVAFADEKEIDELNILEASMLAMRRAAARLGKPADIYLVDGNRDPHIPGICRTIVKGDANSAAIAAASILAKVSRDRYMEEMAILYPQYGFEKHKGYPVELHYEMLRRYGPCEIHRLSFLKNFNEKHSGSGT